MSEKLLPPPADPSAGAPAPAGAHAPGAPDRDVSQATRESLEDYTQRFDPRS